MAWQLPGKLELTHASMVTGTPLLFLWGRKGKGKEGKGRKSLYL